MFYCIMTRGGIGTPAFPNTDNMTRFSMTISNCFLPMNIITKRSIPDAAETLNSHLVIAIQSHHHTVGLRSTSIKSFSRSLVCIIDSGCEISCILIFRYHLTRNMKIFYPFYVEIYFLTTVLCSKGKDSG